MTAPRTIPAPAISETEWQQVVVSLLGSLGWKHNFTRRTIGRGKAWTTATSCVGWPDLTCWHEGQQRLLFAELKTDTGKLTPQQETVLGSLRFAGCEVHVWRPADFDGIVTLLRGRP